MHISAQTLDDLLRDVYGRLLKSTSKVEVSRGLTYELSPGIILELKNPLARLSRSELKGTIYSCLGEFLWYLSGENKLEFIKYYIPRYVKESEDGETIYGGYGPRLFKWKNSINIDKFNQVENVINILRNKKSTRRAVIQLFDANDLINERKEIPCTCTLQFFIRWNRLHMVTNMRSNDAYKGLPHDIFCFTMLQEIIANSLGVKLGKYKHIVGSLHIYDEDKANAQLYIEEGWFLSQAMPAMPEVDPWESIGALRKLEKLIRADKNCNIHEHNLPEYWLDIARLLKIHKCKKTNDTTSIKKIKSEMHSEIYSIYIDKRLKPKVPPPPAAEQLELMK